MEAKDNGGVSVRELLEKAKAALKKFDHVMGIGDLCSVSEVHNILTMPRGEISKLTAVECGECAILLAQEAVFLQSEVNKLTAALNWCKAYLDKLIAPVIEQYGEKYTPAALKRVLAIKDNQTAVEVDRLIVQHQATLDNLAFMASTILQLKMSFEMMQTTKRGLR